MYRSFTLPWYSRLVATIGISATCWPKILSSAAETTRELNPHHKEKKTSSIEDKQVVREISEIDRKKAWINSSKHTLQSGPNSTFLQIPGQIYFSCKYIIRITRQIQPLRNMAIVLKFYHVIAYPYTMTGMRSRPDFATMGSKHS